MSFIHMQQKMHHEVKFICHRSLVYIIFVKHVKSFAVVQKCNQSKSH